MTVGPLILPDFVTDARPLSWDWQSAFADWQNDCVRSAFAQGYSTRMISDEMLFEPLPKKPPVLLLCYGH